MLCCCFCEVSYSPMTLSAVIIFIFVTQQVLVGNDNIMIPSWCNTLGLLLKSQKSDVWQHFHFVLLESCDSGVLYAHDARLVIYFFILYIFCNICDAINCKNIFLLSPAENKEQNISWHNRFAMLTPQICIANVLGWIPPFFPLIMGNFSFFTFWSIRANKINLG